jgi:Fe-S oxidoreductase
MVNNDFKILLSHSYFLRFDPKQWDLGRPYTPLATLYAASVLRQQGYEVSFHDNMFAEAANEIEFELKSLCPRIFVLYDDGFNYLTKMCLTNMREAAFQMMQIAKDHGCTVIISSSDATDHFEEYLQNGADYVLKGEGEATLLELIEGLKNGVSNVISIHGLIYKSGDHIIHTPPRVVTRYLDDIPFPAWDLINIQPYKKLWLQNAGYFSINVVTTRGCPFKCNWCAKPIYGNRYNARSPKNVVDELVLLKSLFNYDHIWFCDDIFGLKPGWVHEFADLIKGAGLSLKFKIQSRADLLVQENYVHSLAKAGCDNVWMGAESGSQKILDAMDKGITLDQISKATSLLKQYGIKPSFFIQFGYPGEDFNDISQTIKMINNLLPYEIGISVSYPLPGTVFYDRVKQELKEKSNWTDSNELALMFSNTYTPEFYKQLHSYVHKNYRKQIAVNHISKFIKAPFKCTFKEIRKAASAVYYMPAVFIEKYKLMQLQKAL